MPYGSTDAKEMTVAKSETNRYTPKFPTADRFRFVVSLTLGPSPSARGDDVFYRFSILLTLP